MRMILSTLLFIVYTSVIHCQCVPTFLTLNYDIDVVALGDTVQVTWESDCESAIMNISLGSLPPLPFQVQQVDNGILNSGSRSFVIGDDLEVGDYLFYIEDKNQNIWDYGDTFRIESQPTICDYPSSLNLTYDLDIQQTGDTVLVTWDADCEGAILNVALVSLPPLSYEVQQVENGIQNTGSLAFVIDDGLESGRYQFYIEDSSQNIWNYGDTFLINSQVEICHYPSILDLTYKFDLQQTGDTVVVTWNADCKESIMNIALVSLPPLSYEVQQVDNGIQNTGSRVFVIENGLESGEYQFYIEDSSQNIWNYGDTFLINSQAQICDYPSTLDLTYDFDTQQIGDTVIVTWEADCKESRMNLSLVSLPPLNFEVQQVDNGISNTGSRIFIIEDGIEFGEYQFYIEDESQKIWNYGDTFLINSMTTSILSSVENRTLYYNSPNQVITWKNYTRNVEFRLYDFSGRFILSSSSNEKSIDVSQLVRSAYFVKGSDGSIFKFIKQ